MPGASGLASDAPSAPESSRHKGRAFGAHCKLVPSSRRAIARPRGGTSPRSLDDRPVCAPPEIPSLEHPLRVIGERRYLPCSDRERRAAEAIRRDHEERAAARRSLICDAQSGRARRTARPRRGALQGVCGKTSRRAARVTGPSRTGASDHPAKALPWDGSARRPSGDSVRASAFFFPAAWQSLEP
jgi:hypothetical protein